MNEFAGDAKAKFVENRERVTAAGKSIVDIILEHRLNIGEWMLDRLLFRSHPYQEVVDSLGKNPKLFAPRREPTGIVVTLSLLGLMFSKAGEQSFYLMAKYVNFLCKQAKDSPEMKDVSSAKFLDSMELANDEVRLLKVIVELSRLGNVVGNENDWAIQMPSDLPAYQAIEDLTKMVYEISNREGDSFENANSQESNRIWRLSSLAGLSDIDESVNVTSSESGSSTEVITVGNHRVEVIESLPSGGQADASVVKGIGSRAIYAYKKLHFRNGTANREDVLARFGREVEALKAIDHRNVVRFVDADLGSGELLMEFISGGTLEKDIRRYRGDPLGAMRAMIPVAEAVSEFHGLGIFHRDITPWNIFVRNGIDLVLGDLGLAYLLGDLKPRLTREYENVGSVTYMPPWAIGKREDEVRETFDIFSLGKILWAMVTGHIVLPLVVESDENRLPGPEFPKDFRMIFIDQIIRGSVNLLEENMKWQESKKFLNALQTCLMKMELGAADFDKERGWVCKLCGEGKVEMFMDGMGTTGIEDTERLGLKVSGNQRMRVAKCSNCGHLEFFHFGTAKGSLKIPPGWK